MRGHFVRFGTLLAVSVLAGCAPAPSPSPSVTPPPVPAGFVAWPDLVWHTVDPSSPGGSGDDLVVAVAAGDDGFVAVGYRESAATRDGIVWWSANGMIWESTDAPFEGVELVDVARAPDGFIALGVESRGENEEHPAAVAFGSGDGRAWARVGPLPATGDTYPESITGGPVGVVAVGSDASGAAAIWRSVDGRAFEAITPGGPAAGGVVDPQAVAEGFLGLGSVDGPPTLLRSADGRSWAATTIDPRVELTASNVVPGSWGIVVQGDFEPGCGDEASCPARQLGWWSLDGATWGRLPGGESPVANGGAILVPAGDHGLLAISGADAWSSPDGWAWRSLPEPGDGSVTVEDAAVRGDVIVGAGALYGDDGSIAARILVAQPGPAG